MPFRRALAGARRVSEAANHLAATLAREDLHVVLAAVPVGRRVAAELVG